MPVSVRGAHVGLRCILWLVTQAEGENDERGGQAKERSSLKSGTTTVIKRRSEARRRAVSLRSIRLC